MAWSVECSKFDHFPCGMAKRNILITGGAGFIGSHVVKLFVSKYPDYSIYNLDKLTYAGNLENLRDIEDKPNYKFIHGDICDNALLEENFKKYGFDSVIHLAAESHVDRSIHDPQQFVLTNVIGTLNLLRCAQNWWGNSPGENLFYHISTDEVYGSLGPSGLFSETTPYDPKSPYSASKASSDHFVRAYGNTFNLPILISNCSNNYGPFQFPEKLIPLTINNIIEKKPIPIYGKGENIRDWLYVADHANAIDLVFHKGAIGETYNIGADNEWTNLSLVELICQKMDAKLDRRAGESGGLIQFVTDRAGHDLRYAIDAAKIKTELNWQKSYSFEQGIDLTIDWYLSNHEWLDRVKSGEYRKYYQGMYKDLTQ